ncbi:MAG TPA: hypothetical protein VGE12_04530 [Noviherbaspirillum sp.]
MFVIGRMTRIAQECNGDAEHFQHCKQEYLPRAMQKESAGHQRGRYEQHHEGECQLARRQGTVSLQIPFAGRHGKYRACVSMTIRRLNHQLLCSRGRLVIAWCALQLIPGLIDSCPHVGTAREAGRTRHGRGMLTGPRQRRDKAVADNRNANGMPRKKNVTDTP